jgi:Ca2+-binding RTX toxin-like protein
MRRTPLMALAVAAVVLLLAGGAVLAKAITCTGGPCIGTKRVDSIAGTTGNDEISGRGGNNHIIGDYPYFSGAGDDSIWDFVGSGDIDQVFAGKGNDSIQVKDGDDLDTVDCGSGKDEDVADPGDNVAGNCEKVS